MIVDETQEIVDADYHARVVLGLVAETVTMGEIEDVRAQLPPEFARLMKERFLNWAGLQMWRKKTLERC